MKILGYMLITDGFLAGALTAAYERPLLEEELAVKKADEESKNGLLVKVMDAARSSGVKSVSLAAEVVD